MAMDRSMPHRRVPSRGVAGGNEPRRRVTAIDSVQHQREPQEPLPQWYSFTVIAQDPSVKRLDEAGNNAGILTASVRVPADWLEPGPRSHRFHVVDYDETEGRYHEPASLLSEPWVPNDQFKEASDETLLASPVFRAQNVFAIAARTLNLFEAALGRRVNWSFGNHQLYIAPHAMAMANAYYSYEDQALVFGYFRRDDGEPVDTCLSHDIIAHETTHAILDALRPRLLEPGLPDQRAFHEGFADIVALLSVFSIEEVIKKALIKGPVEIRDGEIPSVTRDDLARSVLFTIGEQWQPAERGLRNSVNLTPNRDWKDDATFDQEHRRGEILVAAVMQTMLRIWMTRLERLKRNDRLILDLAAEEGAKSASHLLTMVIRALDYTPPGEVEFEDFLDSIVVADEEVAPDDDLKYRTTLREAFEAFDLRQPEGRILDLTSARYENLNFNLLRSDRDEVYRFLWQNADLMGVNRDYYTCIDSILPSTRIGPHGFVVSETVASYIQLVEGTGEELVALSGGKLRLPDTLEPDRAIRLYGAGAIIFDQFGRAKFHQTKPLEDWARQSRRLRHLARSGYINIAPSELPAHASIHRQLGRETGEW